MGRRSEEEVVGWAAGLGQEEIRGSEREKGKSRRLHTSGEREEKEERRSKDGRRGEAAALSRGDAYAQRSIVDPTAQARASRRRQRNSSATRRGASGRNPPPNAGRAPIKAYVRRGKWSLLCPICI